MKAAKTFIDPFATKAVAKQELDINVTTISVSKFLMTITDGFETNPSLIIDIKPNTDEENDN